MKLRARYRKWLSADRLQKEFRARGYQPTPCLSPKEDVCEALQSLTLPECSPLLAEEAVLLRLPETFILTCEYDVLRDDGLLYKKRLNHEGTGQSTFKQDFVPFPTGALDRTIMRKLMKRLGGLPRKYILTHCEEPRHQHLVSQYADQYNRHGHNPHLPPLRKWDRQKLAWMPEKSNYPLVEPPTSYGLLEHLMETWHRKEPKVGISIYHSSYPKPPASAYAPRQRPDTRRILEQSRKQWLPGSLDAPA